MATNPKGKEKSIEAKAILSTVGGSPAPIIHGIMEIRPKFVVLICSEDTLKTVDNKHNYIYL